jgi:uncharacterized oligopeptide transporter (OPT) family protein
MASARRRPSIPIRCSAPQATLMASVAKGLFGGVLPWNMVAHRRWRSVSLIIVVDEAAEGARPAASACRCWRSPIGIYLPLELMTCRSSSAACSALRRRSRARRCA